MNNKIKTILLILMCTTLFSCNVKNNIDISSIKTISDYSENTFVDDIESLNFGKYPKNSKTDEKIEPIEWIILENDVENKKLLLMSKYIIDSEMFNKENVSTTWEKSSIREWLNKTFYELTFDRDEKEKIIETEVLNNDDANMLTIAGNNTRDYIFLLNIEESNKYFNNSSDNVNGIKLAATYGTYFSKEGKNTKYSKSGRNRLKVMRDYNLTDNTWWAKEYNYYWLRSIGNEQNKVAVVNPFGIINTEGEIADSIYIGVRPCMWVKY